MNVNKIREPFSIGSAVDQIKPWRCNQEEYRNTQLQLCIDDDAPITPDNRKCGQQKRRQDNTDQPFGENRERHKDVGPENLALFTLTQ